MTTRRAPRLGAASVGLALGAWTLAGCSGVPEGAEDAVARLEALDIVTAAPPEATLVAQAEDLGSDSGISGRNASVVAVYASAASMDEVADFYVASFPQYDLGEECCTTADSMVLTGWSEDTYVDVTVQRGAPRYRGPSTPEPSPAPSGAELFVAVTVAPRPDLDARD